MCNQNPKVIVLAYLFLAEAGPVTMIALVVLGTPIPQWGHFATGGEVPARLFNRLGCRVQRTFSSD